MRTGRVLVCGIAVLAAAWVPAVAAAKIVVEHGKLKPLPAGQQVSQKVACPDGLHVSGGGAYTAGSGLEDEVGDSAPYDGHDRDKKPDDGWMGSANGGASPTSMRTWAICTDAVKLTYSKAAAEPVSFGAEARPECALGDKAVGGGMKVQGGSVNSPLKVSLLGCGGLGSPEFWQSGAINVPDPAQANGFAICTPSSRIVTNGGSKNLAPLSQGFFTASCPAGSRLLSGGGAGQSSNSLEIASLLPADGSDVDHKANDSWTMWFNNESASETDSMNSHAICLD